MQPWFETADKPQHAGTIDIVAPKRASWPQKVFVVDAVQRPDTPPPAAQPAIDAAIEEARKAGGGVVYLLPGTYIYYGQINLPPNTIFKGAGEDKTWLTFAAQNMSAAPATGYVTSNVTGGWGVEDLTIYTSSAGYYHSM